MDQAQSTPQKTPIINRLFFAFISFLIIMDPLAMIDLYKNGADTPPFLPWMIFAALPIVGLILITVKGDIRLRVHKLWTPIGLAAILFTVVLLITTYDGSSWNNLTESVWYVFGMWLFVAFVDLKILQDYAYFFVLFGFLCTLEFFPAGFRAVQMTIDNPAKIEWGAWVDQLLFITGPIFLYAFYKRIKTNPPGWKKSFLAIGGFIVGVALVGVLGMAISKVLPEDSWQARWFSEKKPLQSVTCLGSLCGTGNYVEPYDKLNIQIEEDTFRDAGVYNLALIIQDHSMLGCDFEIDSSQEVVRASCHKNVPGTGSKEITFPIVNQNDFRDNKTFYE